jgi:hypothetical protein
MGEKFRVGVRLLVETGGGVIAHAVFESGNEVVACWEGCNDDGVDGGLGRIGGRQGPWWRR